MRLVLGMRRIVVPDVIEMGELGADAAEIVPDAGQDGLDLLGRFFREGGRQIGAADPVLAQQRPIRRVTRPNRLAVLIGSK